MKDYRHRFLLESAQVRGVLVQLERTWLDALSRAEYPINVRTVLGHAVVAVPLLTSNLKFEGKLTLQARGEGPLSLLVVQLARWSGEPPVSPLKDVFGGAPLSIQIETGKAGDIYQGLVEITGDALQDALANYFQNSEQLPTQMWLQCDESCAAGLMLQQLPSEQDSALGADPSDHWRRVCMLAETISAEELLTQDPIRLLSQVFGSEDVRVALRH